MRRLARISKDMPQHERKPNLRRSIEHRRFVAAIGICLGCGAEGSCEAAHVRNGSDGGMSLKPGDRFTVPLGSVANCGCHDKQHRVGEITFWGRAGIDPLDVAYRLWTISGDVEAGRATVFKARQRAELRARP